MIFQALQPALMGFDLFGLLGHGSRYCRNHGSEAVEAGVGGLHLLSKLPDLRRVRSDLLVVPSDLRVALESFAVLNSLEERPRRRPEFLKAAKGAAHGR